MSFGGSREIPSLLPELSYDQLKKKKKGKKKGGECFDVPNVFPEVKDQGSVSPAECLSPETNSFHVIRAFFILSACFVEFKVS